MLRKREGAQAQYLVRFESGKMSSIQLVSLPKIVMLFIIIVVLLHDTVGVPLNEAFLHSKIVILD